MANKTNAQLQQELNDALAKILALESSDNATLLAQIAELNGKYTTLETTHNRMVTEHESLKVRLSETEARKAELERVISGLQSQTSNVAELKPEIPLSEDEALIREKIRAGLARSQAIEVIANQKAEDEAAKKADDQASA
jgi:hypothetical protein